MKEDRPGISDRSLAGRMAVPVVATPVSLDDLPRAGQAVLDAPPPDRPEPCRR